MEIEYPFLPEGRTIQYVDLENPFMVAAFKIARDESLDDYMPTGAVIVKDGEVLAMAANGSNYHKEHGCERKRLGIPTGEGYELCEGCHPKNHAERSAISRSVAAGKDPGGADLYLWGHWWCCEPCWESMLEAEIADVYLLSGSEILFNREHPENIVGRQFSE